MSKIVQAVRKMAANAESIIEHKHDDHKFFFTYMEKYLWSLEYDTNEDYYLLQFYPNLEEFMHFLENGQAQQISSISTICFSTKQLDSQEAYDSFKDLFQLLKSRKYDFDKVLDEIIG
ncbi:hypothetical protein Ctha_0657 [Chloroherpeton thalassium ATCC 35110]|uniref:Uncharacterized protein n=1 Tax=Chloroherpeton thalassium (strain ATCC 35110 / GB-78) TaxID=517418 RepID=B3QVR9_CHLT3|nr:hypothetical protein [Chloroherpeton thalassium]ACF13126.1 hypothetical protein Ctha_0657 [Chloroherpeton thalassium ATCC 35110]